MEKVYFLFTVCFPCLQRLDISTECAQSIVDERETEIYRVYGYLYGEGARINNVHKVFVDERVTEIYRVYGYLYGEGARIN